MNHVQKIVRDANCVDGMTVISDKAKTKKYKHERKIKQQILQEKTAHSFDML